MLSPSEDNHSEDVDAFNYNYTSWNLDYLLNIDRTLLKAWSIIFTLQKFSNIRPTSQIPRLHF